MKISAKIIIACTLLCSIGVVVSAGFVGWKASALSSQALYERTSSQLTSVREIKKSEIENYFTHISLQLQTMAGEKATQEAMTAFADSFNTYPIAQVTDDDFSALKNYYQAHFARMYSEQNHGEKADELTRFNQLSLKAKAVQARYIGVNPKPLGSKHELAGDTLGNSYDMTHFTFHNRFKYFLETFGYYDIFLVDTAGNLVYSVFKELDFATNLLTGIYKDTGLGSAFQKANALPANSFHFEDFAPYYPSYEAAASFISAPIYKNNTLIGTLIFQMPIDTINHIMTFDENWKNAGLGLSGQTYLVGQDSLIRSQSRFLIDNFDQFITDLKLAGTNNKVVDQIKAKGSAIGRQKITTVAIEKALAGDASVITMTDFRNIEVISAYAPVNILGKEWAIVTEIDATEAFKDIAALRYQVLIYVLLSVGILIILSLSVSYAISSGISRPIRSASMRLRYINEQNDLTSRLNATGNDEISALASDFNELFSHFQQMIEQFALATKVLNSDTRSMSLNMHNTQGEVAEQNLKAESVAAAVNQMSASISEVAHFAGRAAQYVKSANDTGLKSVDVGKHLGDEISILSQEMKMAVEAIDRLHIQSSSIAEVLDVIQSIAEQTNLLALNAAIEAARAGEQGRGFAVVADEVRSLAARTQTSTEQIRLKIEALQTEINSVSQVIVNANETVERGVKSCHLNTDMLSQIMAMLTELNEMNIQIAEATEQQKSVTDEISTSVTSIADSSQSVAKQVSNVDGVLKDLSSQAEMLNNEIKQFKFK